eukprot:scaffold10055_cov44-Attheya_sp.AAC.2
MGEKRLKQWCPQGLEVEYMVPQNGNDDQVVQKAFDIKQFLLQRGLDFFKTPLLLTKELGVFFGVGLSYSCT